MASGKNFKIRQDSLFWREKDNTRAGIVFFSLSALVHLLLFFGLIFFQNYNPLKPLPPVVQVDLVTFTPAPLLDDTDPAPAPAGDGEVSVKKSKIKKKKRKIKHIKPDISLKKKPKNLKELMAKKKKKPAKQKPKPAKKPKPPEPDSKVAEQPEPENTEETLEQAREELAEQLEREKQEQLAAAMARLKQSIKDQPKTETGQSEGTGRQGYKPIDLYHLVIGSAIEQNWVFNDVLARMDQNLEVRILIKILKSGQIRDIIMETRSGNRYLDESARKAVQKSNPLPPLPQGMHSYDIGLKFGPRGLK